jgi:prepilin-type processing-associated H-X9-DG protein
MQPLTIRKLMILVMQVALVLAFFVVVLPMFIRPRVSHRMLQCASDIRQMGFGISQYTNQNGCFPPGTIPNADLPLDRRLGWGFSILPYINMNDYLPERGTTQDQASTLACDNPVFADLITNRPRITRCAGSLTGNGFIAIAGLGSDAPSLPTSHKRAGIFGDDRQTRTADIKDGTSTTMMLVESDSPQGPWFAGGRATVRGLDPSRQPYLGPNRQFGGNHNGGANVLMADGSVRIISESVAPKVFEALSTMAGGEAVPADFDE